MCYISFLYSLSETISAGYCCAKHAGDGCMSSDWSVWIVDNVPQGRSALKSRYALNLHGVHFRLGGGFLVHTVHSFRWVSIRLQVHTLSRRPPVAPTNCPIHSSAGDDRRPWLVISALLKNFPTAHACWQPAGRPRPSAALHNTSAGGTEGRSSALTDERSIGSSLIIQTDRAGLGWHSNSDAFDNWLSPRLAPPLLAGCSVEMIPWESFSLHTNELQSHLTDARWG